jgi:hypothetical protein
MAMNKRSRYNRLSLYLALFICFIPLSGYAMEIESFGGWEGDTYDQGFGFVSLGSNLRLKGDKTLVARAMGSYLYYNFDSANSTTEVTSPGVTLMLGPRFPVKKATVLLLGGAELRWNRMVEKKFAGFSTATKEREFAGVAQVALDAPVYSSAWVNFMLNYGGANQYTFGRLSLKHQISNFDYTSSRTFFLGVEGVGQGNQDVMTAQGGGFLEMFDSRRKLSLVVRGGYKNSWFPEAPNKSGSYLSLNFYTRFK